MGRFDRIFEAIAESAGDQSLDAFLKKAAKNPFAAAASLKVYREANYYPLDDIDDDVKFFVLALEAAGIPTEFSCGGHPDGWYVTTDSGDLEVGKRLVNLGFFTVELSKSTGGSGPGKYVWVLRWHQVGIGKKAELTMAAKSWVQDGFKPDWKKAFEESNAIA